MFSFTRNASSSFIGRMSPAHVQLLKAALLDGDAAIAAYREWRQDLDFYSLSYGQQRILPLLQRNLTRLGVADPLTNRFRGIRRYFWAQNLKAMTFAVPVFAALDQAGVPFIVLKGAALVACYFQDRSLRPMTDVDVLVPEERLADAVAILARANLFPEYTSADQLRHYVHRRPGWQFIGPNGNMDLHWKALHLDLRSRADDSFWQARRTATLDGRTISVLDPADQLLHICAHAAQSTAGGATFQWPADATFVVRGSPDLSFERLLEAAEGHRVSGIVAGALEFLANELDLPIERSLISRLYSASHWDEHVEMHVLAEQSRTRISAPARVFLEFQDFRRTDEIAFDRPMSRGLTSFLKAWTGAATLRAALIIAVQAILGRPTWLRRLLGRDAYRAAPDPSSLPKIGDTLTLAGLTIDETPLIHGWSNPEPTGRWTVGREATIVWSVHGCEHDLTLSIDGYALLYEQAPSQRIEMCFNDRRIAAWNFRFGGSSPLPAKIRIPHALFAKKDVASLTFLIQSPRSPAEFGVSDDVRPLGLHLRSLALQAG